MEEHTVDARALRLDSRGFGANQRIQVGVVGQLAWLHGAGMVGLKRTTVRTIVLGLEERLPRRA